MCAELRRVRTCVKAQPTHLGPISTAVCRVLGPLAYLVGNAQCERQGNTILRAIRSTWQHDSRSSSNGLFGGTSGQTSCIARKCRCW